MATKPNTDNTDTAARDEGTVDRFAPFTVAGYVAADRKGRHAIRSAIEGVIETIRTEFGTLFDQGEFDAAREVRAELNTAEALLAELKAAAGTVSRTEIDYGQLIANRAATFRRAYALTVAGMIDVPDTADVDMDNLPIGHVDDDLLARLMGTPLVRSTKVNNVPALIAAAFVGQPVNTRLSVADVVNHAAAHGATVSNGAVTAQAAKGSEFNGHPAIVAVASDANGPRGFVNKAVVVIADDDTDTDDDNEA